MSDPRSFLKLHNGMPEHPKVAGLSDEAFRALIELWCYCSRNLTDGRIVGALATRLASASALLELVTAQMVDEDGDDYLMHDYLKHQQSKAQVEEVRENRRKAGRLGGRAKAKALASATANAKQEPKQMPSKSVADTDTDTEERGAPARKRATSLPDDWQPTPAHIERAKDDNVDLERELSKFKLHVEEKGLTSKSWNARFARWLMQAAEYQAGRPSGFGGRPSGPRPGDSLWDLPATGTDR